MSCVRKCGYCSTARRRQELLRAADRDAITTEIVADAPFYYAEAKHQQYLARPGSRPYCSARPTGVRLDAAFPGAAYALPAHVWAHYDWTVEHCVLRGDSAQISLERL
jgi:peptide-methionine (S)-S-oxide reductase